MLLYLTYCQISRAFLQLSSCFLLHSPLWSLEETIMTSLLMAQGPYDAIWSLIRGVDHSWPRQGACALCRVFPPRVYQALARLNLQWPKASQTSTATTHQLSTPKSLRSPGGLQELAWATKSVCTHSHTSSVCVYWATHCSFTVVQHTHASRCINTAKHAHA